MKDYIQMGAYYNKTPFGLIKTVCRTTDPESGKTFIAFVKIKDGYAGNILSIPEQNFRDTCSN